MAMAGSNEYGKDYQDAYVFVPSGSEDTMAKLKDLWRGGQVRYATRVLSGGLGAVAFLEAANGDDGLADLREKLTAVRDAVNPGTSVGVALKVGPRAPTRWSAKLKIGAYVRIRTEHGQAGDVFDAVERLPGYYGSALVLGDWDILLELGANSFEEMKGLLLEQVNPIPGVVWTDSAIVLNDVSEPSEPGEQ